MRKLVSALAVVLAIGAPGVADARRGAGDGDGDGGRVSGSATIKGFGNPTVQVNARGSGGAARGNFSIHYPGQGNFNGKVNCLIVQDSTAYVVGEITHSTFTGDPSLGFVEGNEVKISIYDLGTGGEDKVNFSPGSSDQPCDGALEGGLDTSAGNYVILHPQARH